MFISIGVYRANDIKAGSDVIIICISCVTGKQWLPTILIFFKHGGREWSTGMQRETADDPLSIRFWRQPIQLTIVMYLLHNIHRNFYINIQILYTDSKLLISCEIKLLNTKYPTPMVVIKGLHWQTRVWPMIHLMEGYGVPYSQRYDDGIITIIMITR